MEAQSVLSGSQDDATALDALRRYQSGELLRIGACDLLDLYDLPRGDAPAFEPGRRVDPILSQAGRGSGRGQP